MEEVEKAFADNKGNLHPVYVDMPADLLTPVAAYLKVSGLRPNTFIFESVAGGEKLSRYSFIGADPYKVIRSGPGCEHSGDPLDFVEKEMKGIRLIKLPDIPSFTGGAIGFVAFDCIEYFEPKTKMDLKDGLGIPESILMFMDTILVFDHLRQRLQIITHVRHPEGGEGGKALEEEIRARYHTAQGFLHTLVNTLASDHTPLPPQPPITQRFETVSNVGQDGYQGFVRSLKSHIVDGDIIQAVPSQRLALPTKLHPFNAYRNLRGMNPSPYMFYVDLGDFQLVGASPEMLVKVEDGTVYTHPIAGTRKRGRTPEEDEALASELLADVKERSEHVMLVDLGRNDVNRICDPETVEVSSLMHIERYSHVMHIVSNVSGKLRPECTPLDAFRSIFPAGTVSGAPKVKACQIIRGLEGERRGVYAGSVGHFDYSGDLDTCIAIRTMVFKDGTAYLQAGGGIVYDSEEVAEWEETMNKLGSSVAAIRNAEAHFKEGSSL
ncbi:ADC synthase [Piptocephalis cylindrospora]|uniref:anthranilate synthase n=1 Tax=Piptocephalis cylindrospora TaxID=1907219 RepID=A0A4P9Y9A5_9FUNG|nr:ADC synthase [Piptocephalis cylindrospora]|eukprot:RKP14991.1 ADC synthase [Piptocephalis cylindrospora]